MDFKIVKKGYDKEEVDKFLEKFTMEQKTIMQEQKERIFELKKELEACEKKLKEFENKKDYMTSSIVKAVEKSNEIEEFTQKKYALEMEQLKNFHNKWVRYYTNIIKKYPIDDCLQEVNKFNKRMSYVVNHTPSSDWLFKSDKFKETDEKKKQKEQNINAIEEINYGNSFSLEEALHPAMNLEEILKEIEGK